MRPRPDRQDGVHLEWNAAEASALTYMRRALPSQKGLGAFADMP